MRRPITCLLLTFALLPPAFAQDAGTDVDAVRPLPAGPITDLHEVQVTGETAGPGLWMVSKGTNVMWVLGTQSPMPEKMSWRSTQVNAVIAQSQEVIRAPSVSMTSDIGFFGKLALLPSLVGVRNNPGGATLDTILAPPLYARWQVLKGKYIGRDGSVEKWRPIFAAQKLYDEAIHDVGLSTRDIVWPVIDTIIAEHKVPMTRPVVEMAVESPKRMVAEFKKSPMDDLECFTRTLDRLETDLESMKLRANAWATGDLEAMRALPYTDQRMACDNAIMNASVVQKSGMKDLRTRASEAWMVAVEAALAKNRTTFAVLPMSELLAPDGYLAQLRARGYQVIEP
ncbi:TraB/GumN family protein [Arenimonas oryziterrae]|uniref:TraB/GumN family protein n=1 Tax=Arenimonas oryziterrae DSM 21050 = YC6267 TaxID=1121015 RepID=A0A091BHP9_9GAMM|nr:TraB/GumN family protein [Arenimonas oryziterrae]KFN43875.1 hypothetical protein N789_07975 [Arenimonas oryziterrae DSM 21050 = YC6267]